MQPNEFGWGQYVRSFVERERKSGYLPAVSDVRFGSLADITLRLEARPMSALPPKADIVRCTRNVRFVPCVDGSELARAFFTLAALVGAAMCSAC